MNNNQIFSTDSYEDMLTTQSNPFKAIPFQKEGTWNEGTEGVFDGNAIESFFTNTDKGISSGFSSVVGTKPYELVFGTGMVKPWSPEPEPVPEGKVRVKFEVYGNGTINVPDEPEDHLYGVGDTIRADVVSVGEGYTFEGWYVHGNQTFPMMSETTLEIYIENEDVLYDLIDFFGGSDTTIYACNEEDDVTTYTVNVYAEWEFPIPCSVTPYAPNGKYTEGTVLTISADTPIDAIVFQGWYINGSEEPYSTDTTFTYTIGTDEETEIFGNYKIDPSFMCIDVANVSGYATWGWDIQPEPAYSYQGCDFFNKTDDVEFTAQPTEGVIVEGWFFNGTADYHQYGNVCNVNSQLLQELGFEDDGICHIHITWMADPNTIPNDEIWVYNKYNDPATMEGLADKLNVYGVDEHGSAIPLSIESAEWITGDDGIRPYGKLKYYDPSNEWTGVIIGVEAKSSMPDENKVSGWLLPKTVQYVDGYNTSGDVNNAFYTKAGCVELLNNNNVFLNIKNFSGSNPYILKLNTSNVTYDSLGSTMSRDCLVVVPTGAVETVQTAFGNDEHFVVTDDPKYQACTPSQYYRKDQLPIN